MFIDTPFMVNNFLISSKALIEGRIWTLVTSVFSHNMLFHLLLNMFVFYGFGRVIEEVLGHKRFLNLYLISGLSGSLGHCLASSFLLHDSHLEALGASGAISGVLVFFSLIFPMRLVFILGFLPMPAILATTLFIGSDLWGLFAQTQGSRMPIGFGAHLGGALAGVIYFFYIFKMED
jgi:rhomboid-like protein